MSLDVAIQTFQSQKDSVLWRSLDDYGIVKYYYADDCVYVLKFGKTYAFVKAKSPRLAWKRFCKDRKERDEALGIKKGANND